MLPKTLTIKLNPNLRCVTSKFPILNAGIHEERKIIAN